MATSSDEYRNFSGSNEGSSKVIDKCLHSIYVVYNILIVTFFSNLSARSSLILCLFFLLIVSHIVLERTRTFITHLVKINEKQLCIPVSSAAVEYAFSSAGVVIS